MVATPQLQTHQPETTTTEARKVQISKRPYPSFNGLYPPSVPPFPGDRNLVRGGVERPIPTFPPEGRSCKLTNTSAVNISPLSRGVGGVKCLIKTPYNSSSYSTSPREGRLGGVFYPCSPFSSYNPPLTRGVRRGLL